MPSQRNRISQVLVYVAYGFFLCIGLMMLYSGFIMHAFSYTGFAISGVFILQFIYKKPLVNLILGVLTLFFSIWMLLLAMNTYNMLDKNTPHNTAGTAMVASSIIGMLLSLVLMFSYSKLGSKE